MLYLYVCSLTCSSVVTLFNQTGPLNSTKSKMIIVEEILAFECLIKC